VVISKQNWKKNVTTNLTNYSMDCHVLLGFINVTKVIRLFDKNLGVKNKVFLSSEI
jgi:hypothetical protein